MIRQKEIAENANRKHVPKTTIDKDWILGHFLNALYSFEGNRNLFVFKGGTCLHKCYVKDYRFSEDLDFTLLDKNFVVDKSFIKKVMNRTEEQSSIKFQLSNLEKQQSNNIPQGYKAEIKFWGADHNPNQRPLPPSRWQTSIHIDISFSEQLLLPTVEKEIMHPYSDANLITNKAICYDFKELLAEKIRTLKQRNRPRDIYDVWRLSKMFQSDTLPDLKAILLKKLELKGLEIGGVTDFVNEEKFYTNKIAWRRSLSHQLLIADLPVFDDIYRELSQFINELFA